jgi:hypothetical protein
MKQLLMLIAILALLPFAACTLTMSGCTYGVISGARATTICNRIGDSVICNEYPDGYYSHDYNRPRWRDENRDYDDGDGE